MSLPKPVSPPVSEEVSHETPPTVRQDDSYTAVLIPLGAVAGMILLFALWTTDNLVIPGYSQRQANNDVVLFEMKLGSTDAVHHHVWGIGFVTVFVGVGAIG